MNKQEFYEKAAVILELSDFKYKEPEKKSRWGRRNPGNGSFGIVLVRWFDESCIQISSSKYCMSKTFSSPCDALNFLIEMPGWQK